MRSLTGLEEGALSAAFSQFLDTGSYNEAQIQMVKCMIDWLKAYGTLDKKDMTTDFFGGLEVFDVWGEEPRLSQWRKLQSVISSINNNAERLAA